MLKYEQLQRGVTKVLLPNGCTGVVTEISPIKTVQGGMLRGRGKVKVAYTTKTGSTEAWFQLRQLRTYELVVKKVNTDIQPIKAGEESWKSPDTFNGTQIIQASGKTVEVVVPTPEISDNKVDSLKGMDKVITQKEYDELNTPKEDENNDESN